MDASILSILPNLSVGVVSVLSLVYVVLKFLDALDRRQKDHQTAMNEREHAMRNLESSIRTSLNDQLVKNTVALTDTTKVLAQVAMHLENDRRKL